MIQALHDYSYEILQVHVDDLEYLQGLARTHKDPFDRMLVAQALRSGLTLVTADTVLKAYGVEVLWD